MNSYLKIAEIVLEHARVPMSAREILKLGYQMKLVPNHLYGSTQHKTLQARLSEDLLAKRERSIFYRTEPGRFYLRRFLNESDIPDEFKRTYYAKRRSLELNREKALCIKLHRLREKWSESVCASVKNFIKFIDEAEAYYVSAKKIKEDVSLIKIVTFSMVIKDGSLLCFSKEAVNDGGRRRNELSLGFETSVVESDQDLFGDDPFGFVNSCVRALEDNIALPSRIAFAARHNGLVEKTEVLHIEGDDQIGASFAILMVFQCPKYFDPTATQLASSDPKWIRIENRPNQWDHYDDWSRCIFDKMTIQGSLFQV